MSLTLVLATANPDKAARDRGHPRRGRRRRACCRVRPTSPTSTRPATPCSTTPGSRPRPSSTATGLAAIADDTGLEVDALGGAPGVYSARYAGDDATYADNVAKLLDDLAAVDAGGGDRRARFRTVALVAFPDGGEIVAEGAVDGHHRRPSPRGTGGFGYDPVFVPDEGDGRTFAEMGPDEKNAISHRGRAFRSLAVELAGRT